MMLNWFSARKRLIILESNFYATHFPPNHNLNTFLKLQDIYSWIIGAGVFIKFNVLCRVLTFITFPALLCKFFIMYWHKNDDHNFTQRLEHISYYDLNERKFSTNSLLRLYTLKNRLYYKYPFQAAYIIITTLEGICKTLKT